MIGVLLVAESKFLPTTKKTLVGRAPIVAVGNALVFTSRSGKDILVHEISDESHYKQITELKVLSIKQRF